MELDHYWHFFKTIIETLSPHHYKIIASRKKRHVIAYFYSLIFFALFLSMILALPKFIVFAYSLDDTLAKFTSLNVTVDIQTNDPVLLPAGNPYIVIDTQDKINQSNEMVFADQKGVLFSASIAHRYYSWEALGDLLKKKEILEDVLSWGFLLFLPAILFILFIGYSVKYTLIWIISILIGYLLAKLFSMKVKFTRVVRITGFAATWIILPELLIMPYFFQKWLFPVSIFGLQLFIIPYIIFWVYTLLAFLTISEHRHDKYSR